LPWGNQYIIVLDLETGAQTAFDMVSSAHPSWSPDGSQIAFDAYVTETTTKGKKTTTNVYVEVFIANADGTGAMQVTNFKGTTAGASWSPDGGSLAFMSDIEGTRSIYRYDLSTGVAIFLHDGQGPDWNP
jgi:Tol biopolymer transport system component